MTPEMSVGFAALLRLCSAINSLKYAILFYLLCCSHCKFVCCSISKCTLSVQTLTDISNSISVLENLKSLE